MSINVNISNQYLNNSGIANQKSTGVKTEANQAAGVENNKTDEVVTSEAKYNGKINTVSEASGIMAKISSAIKADPDMAMLAQASSITRELPSLI
ncbi:MAG: hypothetical protein D6B27_00100 [Gammaproteobacteria bacterium]|nr:MAG: hypothetical protein D6B27_00100 [Gammaproteobacteria bacterium]